MITSIREFAKIVHRPWHRTSEEVLKVLKKLFFLHDFVDVIFSDNNGGDYKFTVMSDGSSGMTFEQIGERLKKLKHTKLHGMEDTEVFTVEPKGDRYVVTCLDPYNM